MNCGVRFDFYGLTVLVAGRGDQVSCYTTVGVWECPLKGQTYTSKVRVRPYIYQFVLSA